MRKFTIYHGLGVSLVLHSLLGLPFVAYSLAAAPDDTTLAIDLQSDIADVQTEQQQMQQTKAVEQKEQVAKTEPTPPEDPPPPAEDSGTPAPSPAQPETTPAPKSGDTSNDKGADVQQQAHRIKVQETEQDLINAYTRLLSKKVGAHLPEPVGRAAAAVVSFTVLTDGHVSGLKIAESSGQAELDAGALKAIRTSAPFEPPPKELNLAITVDFTRKHRK